MIWAQPYISSNIELCLLVLWCKTSKQKFVHVDEHMSRVTNIPIKKGKKIKLDPHFEIFIIIIIKKVFKNFGGY